MTQNRIGAGKSGRKQRKVCRANSGKKHQLEPKRFRFTLETTYGPEGQGFESLTACHEKACNLNGYRLSAFYSHSSKITIWRTFSAQARKNSCAPFLERSRFSCTSTKLLIQNPVLTYPLYLTYPGRLGYELYRILFVSYDKPPVLLNA